MANILDVPVPHVLPPQFGRQEGGFPLLDVGYDTSVTAHLAKSFLASLGRTRANMRRVLAEPHLWRRAQS